MRQDPATAARGYNPRTQSVIENDGTTAMTERARAVGVQLAGFDGRDYVTLRAGKNGFFAPRKQLS